MFKIRLDYNLSVFIMYFQVAVVYLMFFAFSLVVRENFVGIQSFPDASNDDSLFCNFFTLKTLLDYFYLELIPSQFT